MSEEKQELTPEQIVALSKSISDGTVKTARKMLKDGKTYEVDFGVRVQGQLIVGHESTFSGSSKPNASQIAQCLLAQFGPKKRVKIVELILSLGVAKSISKDEQPDEDLELLAERLIVGLTQHAASTRAGAVTADVKVDVVQWSA